MEERKKSRRKKKKRTEKKGKRKVSCVRKGERERAREREEKERKKGEDTWQCLCGWEKIMLSSFSQSDADTWQ
jgi:hypothetical protein